MKKPKNNSSQLSAPQFTLSVALLPVSAILFALTATAGAQTVLDGFNPNPNSSVLAMVVQPDSKILIGGYFTTLSPNGGAAVTRNHIARLNSDGTVDPTFDPDVEPWQTSSVYSLALQADGKVLIAGYFTTVGGQARHLMARLDPVTGLPDSFDPSPSNNVTTITPQPDGKILVAGLFGTIGGQPRHFMARLDPNTGLADLFNPNPNSYVDSIAVQADGTILAVGDFFYIDGQYRDRIARLDPATGSVDSFNPTANSRVRSLALQADGKLLIGGDFTSAGGQTRTRMARLDPTTGAPDSFDPNANNTVNTITAQADGKILVSGAFTGANSIGGQSRNRIARLDPTTAMADSFDPNPNNDFNLIAVQADGKILVAGNFNGSNSIGGQRRNFIARFLGPTPPCTSVAQGFDDTTTLFGAGWVQINNSQPGPGITNWFQGTSSEFSSQSGAPNSYIAANYQSGTGASTISNWLISPTVTLLDGDTLTFWTRTSGTPVYPDRLQVRMSTNGVSTDVGTTATSVGDFTALLLDINPNYTTTDYPNVWTQFTVTVTGVPYTATSGRLAFRYFVENGGPSGTNSEFIGIDSVQYSCNTSTPTPAPTPAPTPTPTPTPLVNISGNISYCSNPVLPPAPNVTLTVAGTTSGSTLSDSSGNYLFSLPTGGNYTVTPSKAALAPGAASINTADVIAAQRHYLNLAPLTGCRLTAADVNGSGTVDTIDVTAIQRFFLGASTGIGNVGKYHFNPVSRTYPGVTSDQAGQDYDALVLGDVATHFVDP